MAITYSSGAITVSGAKDTGTATSGGSTTLTDTGQSWATNTYAGRVVWITSGEGVGATGRILSNTATTLTVETFCKFTSSGLQTHTPDSSSSYKISYNLQDIVDAAVGGIVKQGDRQYRISGRLNLSSSAFLHDYEAHLEIDSSTSTSLPISLAPGCQIQFGYLDGDDNAYGGISLVVRTDGTPANVVSVFSSNGITGDLRLYATVVTGYAPNAPRGQFWRIYNGASQFVDFKDVLFNSFKGGMRIRGSDSRCENITFINQTTTAGPINFVGAIGLASNITAKKSDSAFYWYTFYGGSSIQGLTGVNVSRTISAFTQTLGSGNLDIVDYAGDEFSVDWVDEGGGTDTPKVREQYSYTPTVIDNSSVEIEDVRLYVEDDNGTEVFNDLSGSDGKYDELVLQKGSYKLSTGSTISLDTPHIIKYRKYGMTFTTLSYVASSPFTGSIVLLDNNFVSASEAAAGAYTGITITGGATKTVVVSGTRTIQELYDYSQYWAAQSANMDDEMPISTADGLNFSLASGWSITITGSLIDETKVWTGKSNDLTVSSGGFFEDSGASIWEASGSVYYASHIYSHIVRSIGSSDIEGANVSYGDAATFVQLTYNTSLVKVPSLVTDSNGEASGYLVWKIDSTTYSDTKIIVAEYNYMHSVVPVILDGSPIGSSATPNVSRLSDDIEVTKTKAQALAVSGISVTHANESADLGDNTLADSYDNLKARQSRGDDIESGVPGCLSFCEYGLLVTKSGGNYTLLADWIFENVDGSGGTLFNGIVEFDTPASYPDFTLNGVQLNFEGAGAYDLRSSSFQSSVTLDTIGDFTVLVKLPAGTSFVNNDPTNITVEASTAILISNPNIADGTKAQLYNITQDTELDIVTVSGGAGYSYISSVGAGEEVEVGDLIRLRCTYAVGTSYKKNYEESSVASTSNMTFVGSQEDWEHANSLGLNGSTQTEFTSDFPNVEVDVDASGNLFNVADLISWLVYIQTTDDGIRDFYGAISSTDAGNWQVNTGVVDLYLDNISVNTATQNDAVILMRDDNVYPQVSPTSGGGGIGMIQSGLVFVTETGVSGLTPQEAAQLSSAAADSADAKDNAALAAQQATNAFVVSV